MGLVSIGFRCDMAEVVYTARLACQFGRARGFRFRVLKRHLGRRHESPDSEFWIGAREGLVDTLPGNVPARMCRECGEPIDELPAHFPHCRPCFPYVKLRDIGEYPDDGEHDGEFHHILTGVED